MANQRRPVHVRAVVRLGAVLVILVPGFVVLGGRALLLAGVLVIVVCMGPMRVLGVNPGFCSRLVMHLSITHRSHNRLSLAGDRDYEQNEGKEPTHFWVTSM